MTYDEVLKATGLEEDIPYIEDYVECYGSNNHMSMRKYLKYWYDGKSDYLLELFGNKLIYCEPVEYHEPVANIQSMMYDNFIQSSLWENGVVAKIYTIFEEVLFDGKPWEEATSWCFTPEQEELSKWRRAHKEELEFFWAFTNMLRDSWTFAHNSVDRDCALNPSEYNKLPKCFVIDEKAKPFRTIKNFIKMIEGVCRENRPAIFNDDFFNELYEDLEKARILHSQLLNRKMLKGNLCLSIHPLDYMTMNDNGYDWSSCMRWKKGGGEYRIGTLEMLTSPMVVVAYLDGEKEWYPTNRDWTWSNKKWRQLFIVHPSVISGIKDYPYREDELTKIVLNRLTKMVEDKLGWGPYEKEIFKAEEEPLTFLNEEEKEHPIRVLFYTQYMYNDTDCNYLLYRRAKEFNDAYSCYERCYSEPTYRINYSGDAHCLDCGKVIDLDGEDDYCDTLVCPNCSDWLYCEDCGSRIYDRSDAIWVDGYPYCSSCASYCEVCGTPYIPQDNDDADDYIEFIFKQQNRWGNWPDHTIGVCKNCFKDAKEHITVVDAGNYAHLRLYGRINVALPSIPIRYSNAISVHVDRDENGNIIGLVDFSKEKPIEEYPPYKKEESELEIPF